MKTPNFTHDFFDKWSEQSAYVFGFWYADGSIRITKGENNCAYKIFNITNTDKQIMDHISKLINVIPSIRKFKNKNWKDAHIITVNSDKFFDFCYSFVGTIDKTHSTIFPNIPDKYLNHFIRGFFDGDGSIYLKKYRSRHGNPVINLNSSFASSVESWLTLNKLSEILHNKIDTNIRNISTFIDEDDAGGSKLSYGQYDTMLLCEWMYKDSTIFMERKKKIWDDFDKDKLINSKKYFHKTIHSQK